MAETEQRQLPPEAYFSYAGGVNSFPKNHREMGPAQLRHLVNGTVRDGWVSTRPAFRWIETEFENETDKNLFEKGKIQGSCYYQFGNKSYIAYAVDGNLFAFDPSTGRMANINPPGGQPFSKRVHFVYFSTRSGYLISGDGISRQVITKGYASRFADLSRREVPAGLMMADDWGRLAIVDPDRRRIRFSNHEADPDPTFSPLGFDETTSYFLNSRFFEVPSHIGRIVWIGFMPWLDTDTGTGPLAVLGEHGTRYYDVSIPRSQWTVQDISGTMFPNIGGLSHRAQVIRGDNLIFSDQNGRIRTFKNARQEESTLSVSRFDRPVYAYYENEPKDIRRWRMACDWNERILITIQPKATRLVEDPTRYNVSHQGMVIWNGEINELSDGTDVNVWDGLWTGVCPATLDVGLFGSRGRNEQCITLSVDPDGINRPYEIQDDSEACFDFAPDAEGVGRQKNIEMQLVTRPLTFSSDGNDRSLLLKQLDRGAIRIGECRGVTQLQGNILSETENNSRAWFTHRMAANESLAIEGEGCDRELTLGQPHYDAKLQFPADQLDDFDKAHGTNLRRFYKTSIHLKVTGWARLEEMIFDATRKTEPQTQNTNCATAECKRNPGCKPSLWNYKSQAAPARETCCCN